jgi:hypothetical protein
MNKTRILLRAQMMNFTKINEIRESGNKKQNAAVVMGFGIAALVLFLCVYNVLTAQALVQAKEQELIPAYMVAVSSFAILLLTMLYSNAILFGSRDMNMLFSLPVKASEVISSKFLFMYFLNFLIGLIFMVPGGIVWITNTKTGILQVLFYFISVFFVPLIPMCIASCLGVFIVLVSSRFKNRNILSLIFSFVALWSIGYIAISGMQTGSDMNNIGAILVKQITGLYPLSKLFLGSFSFLAFIILSIVTFCLFIKVVSLKYGRLNTLSNTASKYSGRKGIVKRKSSFVTLYQKELGRFFSSYMAVLNTGLGVIFLCVLSMFLLLNSSEQIGEYAGIEDINNFLANYAPIIIASMLSLSCPAASALSLEGKNVWILQSAPVSIKIILNSKLAVNLTLHAFGYLFAAVAFVTRLDMNIIQFIGLLFIPFCYSIFIAVLGISLNKKYPNYKWDNEMILIKQSMPVIISSIIGMVAVSVPILLNWFLDFSLTAILWISALILLIASFCMYFKTCKSNYI